MGGHSNLVGEKMLTWFAWCNYLSPIAEKPEYLWVNLIKKHIIIITIFPSLQAWTLDAHELGKYPWSKVLFCFDDYLVGPSLFSLVLFLWIKLSFINDMCWILDSLMYKVIDQTISDNVKHELFCLEQSKNNVLSISLSLSFNFTIKAHLSTTLYI